MKKSIFLALVMLVASMGVRINAQVTIGSGVAPNPDALLDLRQDSTTTKGLLLPRVNLHSKDSMAPMTNHVVGMMVYNLATSPTVPPDSVAPNNMVTPGYYFNTGTRWERMYSSGQVDWFHMPSIVLDLSTDGTFTVDLYQEFTDQFVNIQTTRSPGAPATFYQSIPAATDLYYYVTAYDNTVFSNLSITASGVLTYTVTSSGVSEATFMNIVFVVK
jgi:hypothetical protein